MFESSSPDRLDSDAPAVTRRAALRGLGGGGVAAALALAVSPRLTNAGPESAHPTPVQSGNPAAVLGAWDLTFRRLDTASEPGPARSLAAFLPEGAFQAAMAPLSVTPDGRIRFHGTGLGGWSTWDGDTIIVRYTGLVYDDAGSCDGVHQVTITITADAAFSTLSGAYESRVFDKGGEPGEFTYGTMVGVPARSRTTSSPSPTNVGPLAPVASTGDGLPPQRGLPGEPF